MRARASASRRAARSYWKAGRARCPAGTTGPPRARAGWTRSRAVDGCVVPAPPWPRAACFGGGATPGCFAVLAWLVWSLAVPATRGEKAASARDGLPISHALVGRAFVGAPRAPARHVALSSSPCFSYGLANSGFVRVASRPRRAGAGRSRVDYSEEGRSGGLPHGGAVGRFARASLGVQKRGEAEKSLTAAPSGDLLRASLRAVGRRDARVGVSSGADDHTQRAIAAREATLDVRRVGLADTLRPDAAARTWGARLVSAEYPRRRDPSPRNIHVAAAASPRPVSTEYPRRGRGVAATCLRKIRTAKVQ